MCVNVVVAAACLAVLATAVIAAAGLARRAYLQVFSGPASSRLRLFEVIPCHVMFFA